MFDMLKNLGDLPSLMRKAQDMQQKMARVQEELGQRQVSADAGAGMVTATVNGKLELVKIRIDKDKIDITDIPLVEDMVTAAVAAAQRKATDLLANEMQKIQAELGLPPGGLPFSG
jgi:DNA-binding YbaB/EbfC family protein